MSRKREFPNHLADIQEAQGILQFIEGMTWRQFRDGEQSNLNTNVSSGSHRSYPDRLLVIAA